MKVEIGGFGEPVQQLNTNRLTFVAEDGRTALEMWIGKDGCSLEIRGVSVTKIKGQLYDSRFSVHPVASNGVDIRLTPYKD